MAIYFCSFVRLLRALSARVFCLAAAALRDTRSEPANKPMMQTDHGMQVDFPSWEVIYLFQEGGNGIVFDMDGDQIGAFSWSQ